MRRMDSMEAASRVLTCQRKSELLVFCVCGHAAWEHAGSPDDDARLEVAPDADADADDSDWAQLVRGTGGNAALLPLCPALAAAFSVESALALLDDRVTLLRRLKESGVAQLKQRQDLANALGRSRRLAALEEARANKAADAPARWQMRIDVGAVKYEAQREAQPVADGEGGQLGS
jgi:hypothetical protein